MLIVIHVKVGRQIFRLLLPSIGAGWQGTPNPLANILYYVDRHVSPIRVDHTDFFKWLLKLFNSIFYYVKLIILVLNERNIGRGSRG